MPDILIVEDNREIAGVLSDFLQRENYTVSIAGTGEKALDIYERYGARLIILDIMLPGVDGFAVCSKLRESSNTHIIVASARTSKEDKLKGLMLGADDYIEKPYDIDILLAKIRGIMQRRYGTANLVCGSIRLCTESRALFVGDRQVSVTDKEFELMELFMRNPNVTLRKEYIFNTIWGSDSDSEPQTLTVHVNRLREKLERNPKKPEHIITQWGVGYRFE